ncbi:unnamed protein product [Parnassius apollo]|uniref:(apollo) hypothetical protein n=1 Tax=Parnassius apollo TaxID=110799 RepID=A0A8S3XZN3_PARAO|nr:unnamed protein product [Parnassius apollo]
MDSATFEDWFLNHLMPVLKKKNGRKVVIGDNLASHINKTVLNECEKHNCRAEACPQQKTIRKKKLNVPLGKSICATNLAETGPSGLQQAKTIKEKKRATKRRQRNVSSSSSCSDRTISLASSTEDHIMPYDSEDDVLLDNYVSQISDTDAPAFRHSPDLQQESEVEEECGSPVLQVTDVEQQLFDAFKDFTPLQSIEDIQIVEEKCTEREEMQVVVEDCRDKNLRVSPAREIEKLPQDKLEPPGSRRGSL